MDIQYLKDNRLLILEALSGSKAYGLDTPESDDDFKGVFMLPREQFYGLQYIPQINMDDNNAMFYEWRRFVDLLSVNNPNILELLETPADALISSIARKDRQFKNYLQAVQRYFWPVCPFAGQKSQRFKQENCESFGTGAKNRARFLLCSLARRFDSAEAISGPNQHAAGALRIGQYSQYAQPVRTLLW